MPGLRGTPEVITTTSESAVWAQPSSLAPYPTTRESEPSIGQASSMSSATPPAFWSAMSMMTTSASSLSAIARATVAPTLPAPPTTVTLRFMNRVPRLHVPDDLVGELRRTNFRGAIHQPGEVVGHVLPRDRAVHALDDQVRR